MRDEGAVLAAMQAAMQQAQAELAQAELAQQQSTTTDAAPEAPLWRRLLMLPGAREGTPSGELEQVIAALSATRAEVIVLDRKSGRRLGREHRAAMRRLEPRQEAA